MLDKDTNPCLNERKKELKVTLVTLLSVVLLISVICFLYKPIYYRLYFGDRIKGTISFIVDGEAYHLQPKEIQGANELELTDNGNIAELSIHGGEYGGYPIFVYVDTADLEALKLRINCFQHNWWNVTEFKLNIAIDTKQNSISYSGDYTTIADNGKKCYDKIEKQQSLDEENLGISFGL
ncbi:MAG: hypothetical protein E7500_07025 [Ruminococcus sp.]|nr:hypothetical protein [Ruminococcus sp.]